MKLDAREKTCLDKCTARPVQVDVHEHILRHSSNDEKFQICGLTDLPTTHREVFSTAATCHSSDLCQ